MLNLPGAGPDGGPAETPVDRKERPVRQALEGVRVLDFSQMMMGPWGTQFLGDMGADIIKVERPVHGEWERSLRAMGELLCGESPYFLAMNRNKRSLTANLKHPKAREIIGKIAAKADLVVENFRPGVLDKLGLGYEDLRKINPSIVYVSGSGWGPDGPYVDRPGQDLLVQAMSGLAAYGGREGENPTPCGSSVVDASTALMIAFSSMVGLYHKLRTGEGQKIDVCLFNTAIAVQCQEMAIQLNMTRKIERSRAGIGGAWLSAPFGVYRASDGYLVIAMASLTTLGELIGEPGLARYDNPTDAFEKRDEIKPLIDAQIATEPVAHWLKALLDADIWCAKVQDFPEVERDPQVAHNGLIAEIEHKRCGPIRVVGIPAKFSKTPGTIRLAPPLVGEHNAEVLAELGYDGADAERFAAEGVI